MFEKHLCVGYSRRTALQAICGLSGSLGLHPWARAQTAQSTASVWRAASRVGYGPSVDLLHQIQAAASPRDWALAQVDGAHQASAIPPRIPTEMMDFNAPLPQLFDGAQKERQARKQVRSGEAEKPEIDAARFDFAGERDPLHFSRLVVQQGVAWRLLSASRPSQENPLLARMTEFWFNHLNVYAGKGAVRPFVGHYAINVARAHALGRFEDLLLASARHPAMLFYLDQVRSVADGSRDEQGGTRGLNENYARELMELHTLGVDGGYSQNDVHALARVLTGWTVGPNHPSGFRFVARLHDIRAKQVMGSNFPGSASLAGEEEGVNAVRMLARHPSTARRVCLRLAQFFVSDQPSESLVARLSRTFLSTQGDLREVMTALIASDDFWLNENRLFKTPMDYACSVLCGIQTPLDKRNLVLATGFLANAGQPVHGWQTPDGYKTDAATWLVPQALTRRADFALAVSRQSTELEFLHPFLSADTRAALASERPALRAGLALASPDFMYK